MVWKHHGHPIASESSLSAEDRELALTTIRDGQLHTRDHNDDVSDFVVPVTANGQTIGVVFGHSSPSGGDDKLYNSLIPEMTAGGVGVALLTGLAALALSFVMATPLRKLTDAAQSIGKGQLEALPQLGGSAEIRDLSSAFGHMIGDLRTARAAVDEQRALLEAQVRERTATLEQTLADLRASVTEREQLNATVRELASPIIPVLDGIVVMPLIGVIDTQRAATLINALLRGIEHHHARTVILDVTGVPIIDTYVARTLLEAAGAARLLGTQTILVGLRPELAQTIVGLGVDLRNLITLSDLQSGVSYAMTRGKS